MNAADLPGAVTHHFVEANGLRMHVAEQGAGPVVLLCHGFPETWYAWRHQLPALAAAGFRAVAPDLRGYGDTGGPGAADQYTLSHLLGDLVALLDALGAPQAVVVGNDWGATLAWHAARARPDRFRAVVALGVPFLGRPPARPTALFPQTADALFYALYFQTPGAAEAEFERDVAATLRKVYVAASGDAGPRAPHAGGDATPNPFGMVSRRRGLLAPLPDPRALPAWLPAADLGVFARAYATTGFGGGLNYYRNLDRNWELDAALAGLPVAAPALYLAGERDPGLAIPGMRELIAGMPRLVPRLARTVTLPGCGHWAPQERPGEVNAALLQFLRDL